VKAERSGKTETQVFGWTLPRRILFYPKIVKAERSGKTETQVFGWMLPRRILFYPKIVKAERSNKGKTEFSPGRSQGIGGKQRFWFNEVEHVRNKRKHMPAGCAVLL